MNSLTSPVRILACLLALVVLGLLWPSPTRSQPVAANAALKIGVVDPQRVFHDMAETKALNAGMEEASRAFASKLAEKQAALKQLQSQRDSLKDGPQKDSLGDQFVQQSLELKSWADGERAKVERVQKRRVKMLFDKVQSAIADVAKRDGIDLVVTQTKDIPGEPDLEQLDMRGLQDFIRRKNVLYASERLEISEAVLTVLDAQFKATPK